MKKLSLLLAAFMIAGSAFACDGSKDCCKKGQKEGKACCKKEAAAKCNKDAEKKEAKKDDNSNKKITTVKKETKA